MDNNIIDLDALLPEPRFIKFGGEQFEIKPPKTGHILKLSNAAIELSKATNDSPDQVEMRIDDLTGCVGLIIPELVGKELTLEQLQAIVKIVMDMATPKDVKELEARGITPNSPKEAPEN